MSISTYGFGFFRPLDNVTFKSSAMEAPPYWHVDAICKKEYNRESLSRRPGPYSLTGLGVDIYVFSTGVNIKHSELQSRAFLLPNYTSTLAADSVVDGVDCAQTGTGMAVLCAGYKTGVAHRATVYSAKITNSANEFNLEDFKLACEAAIDNKLSRDRPSVAVISYYRTPSSINRVIPEKDDAFEQAVDSLVSSGFLVIVPAGDGFKRVDTDEVSLGYLNSRVVSPARMESVFTVGCVDPNLDILKNSCYGEPIDAYAPGFGIVTANFDNDYYESREGSVYAAALTAGCAALFLEKLPNSTTLDYKLFSKRHFPQYHPNNYPYTVLDEDAVLGASSIFENRLSFVDSKGMPVSYIPEPLSFNRVRLLKSFFTKGILEVKTEEGNIGYSLNPGNFRFQVYATSKNFYGEERPIEYMLLEAPPNIVISRTTGVIYGEVLGSSEENIVLKIGFSDGVYSEQKTYTITLVPNNVNIPLISGKVTIKKENWCYIRGSELSDILDSQPLEEKGASYADSREVVMLDRDSGMFLDSKISDKKTGIFRFRMLPGNYQILVKHGEKEKYQIKDLRIN